jgi:hypothetical protein
MGRKLADLAPAIDDVPGRVDGEHCVLRYGLPPVPAISVVAAKRSISIVQLFELGGVTRLIRSAVKFCKAGNLKKKFLMVQSHERGLKLICAA